MAHAILVLEEWTADHRDHGVTWRDLAPAERCVAALRNTVAVKSLTVEMIPIDGVAKKILNLKSSALPFRLRVASSVFCVCRFNRKGRENSLFGIDFELQDAQLFLELGDA